jgi:hypothetical protein
MIRAGGGRNVVVGCGELTDAAWAQVAPLLQRNRQRGGRWTRAPHRDQRDPVALPTGAPSLDLAERYGPWKTSPPYEAVNDVSDPAGQRSCHSPGQVAPVVEYGQGGRGRQRRPRRCLSCRRLPAPGAHDRLAGFLPLVVWILLDQASCWVSCWLGTSPAPSSLPWPSNMTASMTVRPSHSHDGRRSSPSPLQFVGIDCVTGRPYSARSADVRQASSKPRRQDARSPSRAASSRRFREFSPG